jgi:hypothetical protein
MATKYQVAATCGEGQITRLTRPLPRSEARRVCRDKRNNAIARGKSRSAAHAAFVVVPVQDDSI